MSMYKGTYVTWRLSMRFKSPNMSMAKSCTTEAPDSEVIVCSYSLLVITSARIVDSTRLHLNRKRNMRGKECAANVYQEVIVCQKTGFAF